MMSFVKNLTEYSVGIKFFEFSLIPIEFYFNHNSRKIFGNLIGFTEIYWGILKSLKLKSTGILNRKTITQIEIFIFIYDNHKFNYN